MPHPPSVLTIGVFDGVHRGHAALVARARALASPDALAVALAFDPHPLSTLRPGAEPARLTTFAQRERLLLAAGADRVARLEPTTELLGLTADAFLHRIREQWRPIAFVEGPDFRFGKGRGGDVALLRERGARGGFSVEVVEPVAATLGDHTVAPASSTLARWLLENGRLADAARVLGHPYELEGVVVRGDRRGRTIGFPTANLRTECLIPADGVYAGLARLDDGRAFAAAVSIGTKPTFGGRERAVEACLLDAPADGDAVEGLPEYGWGLRLTLLAWVREQVRFLGVESLVEQMHRDCLRVRELAAVPPVPLESLA